MNSKSHTIQPVSRWVYRIILPFLLLFPFFGAFGQSGMGQYDAIPIAVGACGNTSFYDYRSNAYPYSNTYGNISPDIWYTFTLSASTNVNISLCGSGFDTYLWILDQNGNQVAYNDDNGVLCSGTSSSVSQIFSAGTYFIVTEGYGSYTGNINLAVDIMGNGSGPSSGAGMAYAINAGIFSGSGSFTDTRSNADACLGNNYGQMSNDIFYRFTLTNSATVSLSHCGSSFDTYMYLLDQSGNLITFSDDSWTTGPCPGSQSYIQTTLGAGTYYVVSEGYSTNTGSITTNISVNGSSSGQSISYTSPNTQSVGLAVNLSPTVTGGSISATSTVSTFTNSGAGLYNPISTATDAAGNVYVADAGNHMIRKISPNGTVSTLAGAGYAGYADGQGTSAVFQHPSAIAVDGSGNVFVSDQQNHRIRKITPSGSVTTFAGSGSPGFADGTGTGASFQYPMGLAFDGLGNLFVADAYNHRIRKITPSGTVSTYAGTGAVGSVNSTALLSTFNYPMGLALDAAGNLYIADRFNHMVRKISASGNVTTLAGSGSIGSSNGAGTGASFNYANGVAVDGSGNVYVADQQNNMIRKITQAGVVTTLAGTTSAGSDDGDTNVARFTSPYGLCIDTQGNLYIAENSSNRIRKITMGGYTISPALPSGLAINPLTGVISGIPINTSPMTVYTITVSGTSGILTTTISLEVVSAVSCLQPSLDQNYVVTYIPREENFTTRSSVMAASCDKDRIQTSIAYFDALGRPLQNVQVMGSPSGKDLIVPMAFDAYGREALKYLPYAESTNGGAYRSNALLPGVGQSFFYNNGSSGITSNPFPYSKTIFETSSLGVALEQGAPGAVWQPLDNSIAESGHTLRTDYGKNNSDLSNSTTGFAVRIFRAELINSPGQEHITTLSSPGFYPSNQLIVKIIKDENWNPSDGKAGTVEDYKDNEGHTVLKRHFNLKGNVIEVISCYYVYDDLGNLCYVLPAGANPDNGVPSQSELDNYCYQYRYDSRKRLIEKQLPGKKWELMVYNPLDQLVFSQDPNLRDTGKWLFTKYDAFGRIIITGTYDSGSDRATLQDAVNSHATNFEEVAATGIGYTNNALPQSISYYHSINYYDNYNFPSNGFGAPSASQASGDRVNTLLTATKTTVLGTGTMLLTVNYYDLEGRIVQQKSEDLMGGSDGVSKTYNFQNELRYQARTHLLLGVQTDINNEYRYDHLGRKTETLQQISTNGLAGQNITLSKNIYNELGQLTQKQLNDNLQHTDYSYNQRGWLKTSTSNEFSLQLTYNDGVIPQFNGNISGQTYTNGQSNSFEYKYDKLNRLEKSTAGNNLGEEISYDVMGNIVSLRRDNFGLNNYSGYNGNRLTSISGFINSNYGYDNNGNLKVDTQKGITDIEYNFLNLPRVISGSQSITFTYDANGNKLRKQSSLTGDRYYINGIEYVGGAIELIHTEEGVARNQNGNYSYEFNLPDHLGNVRATFYKNPNNQSLELLQRDDYYAFGLRKDPKTLVSSNDNKYLYNGKEFQDDLKEYDYGARFYDPALGRWNVIDPMAENDRKTNPYAYVFNNPINVTDPDGMFGEHRTWDGIWQASEGKDEDAELWKGLNFRIHASSVIGRNDGSNDAQSAGLDQLEASYQAQVTDRGPKPKKKTSEQIEKEHKTELKKYGKIVAYSVLGAYFQTGEGISVEYGEIITDSGYGQRYRTISVGWGVGGGITSGGGAIISKGDYEATFSDWSGDSFGGSASYSVATVSLASASAYYTIGFAVGFSSNLGVKIKSSPSANINITTLVGKPYKLRDYSGFSGNYIKTNGQH